MGLSMCTLSYSNSQLKKNHKFSFDSTISIGFIHSLLFFPCNLNCFWEFHVWVLYFHNFYSLALMSPICPINSLLHSSILMIIVLNRHAHVHIQTHTWTHTMWTYMYTAESLYWCSHVLRGIYWDWTTQALHVNQSNKHPFGILILSIPFLWRTLTNADGHYGCIIRHFWNLKIVLMEDVFNKDLKRALKWQIGKHSQDSLENQWLSELELSITPASGCRDKWCSIYSNYYS